MFFDMKLFTRSYKNDLIIISRLKRLENQEQTKDSSNLGF